MNEGQMEQLQGELIELQAYLKNLAHVRLRDPIALALTQWANTVGTIRVLLDVFADEWAESVRKGEPGVETPGKTSANCNDFDEVDYF